MLEFFLPLFYTFVFIVIIYKLDFFNVFGLSKKNISFFFIIKILCGYLLSVIYTHYYTDRTQADIFKYYDDSKAMYDALFINPKHYFQMLFGVGNNTPDFNVYYSNMNSWTRKFESNLYNEAHTIIRFNAFVRLFSVGNYHVHTVFICFLSLTGLVAIYKTFINFLKDKKKELIVAVFFIPSVVFWGSGVLKEGVLLFALGMLIYYYMEIINGSKKYTAFLWITISFFLVMMTKLYVLIALLPVMIAYAWVNYSMNKHAIMKYAIVLLLYIAAGSSIRYLNADYDPLTILSGKQMDFKLLSDSLKSGSRIHINNLEPKLKSFVINTPNALLNALVKPFLWDSKSPFILLAALENLIFIIIAAFCFLFIKRKHLNWNLLLFIIIYVLLLSDIIGLTTPVAGAIVRYKVPALPFLMIFFILLLDKDKLVNRFSIFKFLK